MGRLLVVYHALPYRCNVNEAGQSSSFSEKSSLIPPSLEVIPSEVPARRRRRTRSSMSHASFSGLTGLVEGMSLSSSEEKITPLSNVGTIVRVEAIHHHPSLRIPSGNNLKFIGLADTENEVALDLIRTSHDCIPVMNCVTDPYLRYCERVIVKLFHYTLFEKMRLDVELVSGWPDFEAVNRCFAQAIVDCFQEGDQVLILDHRLALVPEIIREISNGKIPVALHLGVPFPSSEIFRCHPQARELLEGMLGADLIVFQVFSYIRHFMSTCTRLLGLESTPKGVDYNGIPVKLCVIPVGIDAEAIRTYMIEKTFQTKLEVMRKIYRGRRVLLGIDGIESAKGVGRKLAGYAKLLETEPKWIGETVLVQIVISREADTAIVEAADQINNKFGFLGFNPVQVFHVPELNPMEYLALLTIADVLLVISERAAFSIPALEYIVCQEKRHGLIVMSEFIGNAVFIPNVMLVNPWDVGQMARVMQDALTIPIDDMIIRHEEMMRMVNKFDNSWWFNTIMEEFQAARQAYMQCMITPALDTNNLFRRYLTTDEQRLILLDYDGTLIGIKKTPVEAIPSLDVKRALRMLCRDPDNLVYVISGRDKDWLESALGGIDRLGLCAEHGCYLRPVPEENHHSEWIHLVRKEDLVWKPVVIELMKYYTDRTPGSFIEEKSASVAWHYRLASEEFGGRQAKALQNGLDQSVTVSYPVEVLAGKKNIEVRPLVASKGNTVRSLLSRHPTVNLILCIGDDRTDEDMFKTLLDMKPDDPNCFTCKVGASKDVATTAKYGLKSVEQVLALLTRLAIASSERLSHATI